MVISMTGFGSSKVENEQFSISVEIKSVNHRFLEYNIRLPRTLLKIEDKIKKVMNESIARGRIEASIVIEGAGYTQSKVHIDWQLIDEYLQAMKAIANKHRLNDITIQDVLSIDEVLSIDKVVHDSEELEMLILSTVKEATKQLRHMREIEGAHLENDMHQQLTQLKIKVNSIMKYAPSVVLQYRDRLEKRMQEISIIDVDESRIVSEVALFADKADINEEITRLLSHMEQFSSNLKLNEPIGRKLDFLLQEMNREVNTIGSKANHYIIASEVVEIKSLLEKLKEQVQNIE